MKVGMTSTYDRMKKLLAFKIEALILVFGSVLGGEYLNAKHPIGFTWHLILIPLAGVVVAYRIFEMAKGFLNERKK